jgi:hypothetical protein
MPGHAARTELAGPGARNNINRDELPDDAEWLMGVCRKFFHFIPQRLGHGLTGWSYDPG